MALIMKSDSDPRVKLENVTTNDSTNWNTTEEVSSHLGSWQDPLVLVELCFMTLIVIVNTAGLASLLRRSQTNPSFNVYLGNLLLANLAFALLENPLDLLFGLAGDRWTQGPGACDLFVYCNYVTTAWAMHAHVLISLNRLWAVTRPHSYRHRHTVRLALLLCAGAFLYVHVWNVPGIVLDALYYRESLEHGECALNVEKQRAWVVAMQTCLFLAPIVFVGAAYAVVGVKHRQRLKIRQAAKGRLAAPSASAAVRLSGKDITVTKQGATSTDNKVRQQNSQAFLVLTLLTGSLLITWSPYEILQIVTFTLDDFKAPDELAECLDVLWTLQAVLDPLLSTHLITDVREIMHWIRVKLLH